MSALHLYVREGGESRKENVPQLLQERDHRRAKVLLNGPISFLHAKSFLCFPFVTLGYSDF